MLEAKMVSSFIIKHKYYIILSQVTHMACIVESYAKVIQGIGIGST